MAEAFLYCWTDCSKSMIYLGYHKGIEDDGYICSSKLMMQEYRKRPSDFTRQIVAHGNAEDIRSLEKQILLSVDAMHDPHYYNMSNNNGHWRMVRHTEEAKLKMSISRKGKPLSTEHKTRIGLANKGRVISEEGRNNMSIGKIGKKRAPHSDETKLKMSLIRKEYYVKKNNNGI